jgi:hypothetical protein
MPASTGSSAAPTATLLKGDVKYRFGVDMASLKG